MGKMGELELKLAWAAGFLDGEGYVGLSNCTHLGRPNVYHSVVLDAAQVKKAPLDRIVEILGGRVRVSSTKYGQHYSWRLYGPKAVEALKKVLPYLVNKDQQARLCIDFQETRDISIVPVMKSLNARRSPDAERLSEETPTVVLGDAIVRSTTN